MRIFLDANILVTVLNKEFPLYPNAARILSLSNTTRFKIYTSPICLAIAFYFAGKRCGETKAREKIKTLISHINLTTVDEDICKSAAQNPKIHDYEDGLQYYSAKAMGCEIIITTDTEDFYFSSMPILTCEDFLSQYFNQQ